MVIDARPSDAIALALRADCPIYVTEQVLQAAKLNTSGPAEGQAAEQLRGWLEELERRGFGALQDVAAEWNERREDKQRHRRSPDEDRRH